MNKKLGMYELKLFDKPLLRLSLDAPVSVIEVDASCLDLLPAGLSLDDEGFWKWLSARAIPQNRKFSEALCRHLDLSVNDRSGILAAGNGLS